MPKILLIEDDPLVAELVQDTLAIDGHGCRWAATCAAGMAALQEQDPDIVLLDIRLPDGSGYDLLRRIREVSEVQVILLTAMADSHYKVRGLDLGADDYLTKPFAPEELLARIRARLRRSQAAERKTLRFDRVRIDLGARAVYVEDEEVRLTPTEYRLLTMLAERNGDALTREELATVLSSTEEAPEQALQTHISRLRRKIGDNAKGKPSMLIQTVWGTGYRLRVDK